MVRHNCIFISLALKNYIEANYIIYFYYTCAINTLISRAACYLNIMNAYFS